jgi:hypothetical protein
MMLFIGYFLVSYALVSPLSIVLWVLSGRAAREWRWPLRYAAGVVLLLPLAPYVIVESQTAVLGPRLRAEVQRALRDIDGGNGEIHSLRVLSVRGGDVAAYVVSPCSPHLTRGRRAASVIHLRNSEGGWRYTGDWETVWSQCGNADGNVFPPYPGKL